MLPAQALQWTSARGACQIGARLGDFPERTAHPRAPKCRPSTVQRFDHQFTGRSLDPIPSLERSQGSMDLSRLIRLRGCEVSFFCAFLVQHERSQYFLQCLLSVRSECGMLGLDW